VVAHYRPLMCETSSSTRPISVKRKLWSAQVEQRHGLESMNEERIRQAIEQVWPDWISNSKLEAKTGVRLHQQVFQLTQKLMKQGAIRGERRGREWFFIATKLNRESVASNTEAPTQTVAVRDCTAFESRARVVLGARFGVRLMAGRLPG